MRAVCGEGKWEWSAWRRPGPAVIDGHVQVERGRDPPLLCGRRSKDTAPVQALRSGVVEQLMSHDGALKMPDVQSAN